MLRPINPFIEYAINYDYIANVLCKNKDNKTMHCNGKCYVMKQLKKQQEDDLKSLQISTKDYPVGFVSILKIKNIFLCVQETKNIPLYYENKHSYSVIKSKYHPPEFA